MSIGIGGTFTDIVALSADGSVLTRKVSSTPDDYGEGILDGLDSVLREAGIAPADVGDVVHATTVATNAVLEGKGAKTGLVTTAGFRDVLEMRRIRVPDMYNLDYRKPAPLVPRRLRREVVERMGPRGEVRTALDEASARAAARRLREEGVEAVAVALLHTYANPAHELRVAQILRERTLFGRLDEAPPEGISDAFARLQSDMQQRLVEDGHDPDAMHVQRFADLRYARQAFELTVPVTGRALDPTSISRMKADFHEEHQRTYGHKSAGSPVEMVNIRIRMTAPSNAADTVDLAHLLAPHANDGDAGPRSRTAYPIHLGSFPDAMRRLVAEYGETAVPGDIFAFNDPYGSGGMHLPDVFVVKPVFVDGAVVGYTGTLGHQSDIGGIAPGSMALYATEIYQEGLRIPLMKLYDAGEPNRTLFQLLEKNVRVPVEVLGDIDALVAACASCERGLERLVTRYGRETFARYVEALHDHAERLMREEIAAMPDGVHEFEDWLDGMGDVPEPVRFKVTITISGDTVEIDWAGTSGQLEAAINGPLPTTNSMAYLAVRCAARSPIPNCEGFIRPITVTAPLGSVVNPTEPAACASRGIIAYRMLDAMFGALSEVAPERIPAACEGGPTSTQFSCTHEGRRYVTGGGSLGCWGGRHQQDGLDGVSNPGANMSNQPIELIEASVPMEISRYGLIENSGGPGRSRGGYGLVREYKVLSDEATLHVRSDRRAILPYGLHGGLSGTPSWNIINPGPAQYTLPVCPMRPIRLGRGDRFQHIQPGGGGFGSPLERDPEMVLDAVDNEMITPEYAFDVYGVVIDGRTVDHEATAERRRALAASPADDTAHLRHFHQGIGIDPAERPKP